MSSAARNAGRNLGGAAGAAGSAAKQLDGGKLSSAAKAGSKDAKVDIPLNKPRDGGVEAPNTKPKDDAGIEAPNSKPKDTGLDAPPPPKSALDNMKDLGRRVLIGGGIAGAGAGAAFLPGLLPSLLDKGRDVVSLKMILDALKEMFKDVIESPEALAALVAAVGLVAYMSMRR